MDAPADLAVALAAADRASRLIREHYERWQPVSDAPADITTATDRAAQEMILQHLRQAFPGDGLCAEEATATLAAAAGAGNGRVWVVDPIDGTRGFARKNGEFSVMVALCDAAGLAVGVVQEPALDRVTFAWRGGGCWGRSGDGEPQPCRVSPAGSLAEATLVQSHARGAESAVARRLAPARVVETYSAGVKLARVARGEADLYVNSYAAFHDWDICAGELLVREAGGRVTDLRGDPIGYGAAGWKQTQGLLASNGALHAAALAALA
jgi:3'(2'), 5'-bisphosphate nucleotidase